MMELARTEQNPELRAEAVRQLGMHGGHAELGQLYAAAQEMAASLGVADSVVVEAALSFLGFGIPPTEASLGTLLNVAFEYLNREPYLVLFPSVVLVLIVLAANFIGDGLRLGAIGLFVPDTRPPGTADAVGDRRERGDIVCDDD